MNKLMIKFSALLFFSILFAFEGFAAPKILSTQKTTVNNRPVEIRFEVDNGWSEGYYTDSNGNFIGSDNGDIYLRAYYTDTMERCYENFSMDLKYVYNYYDVPSYDYTTFEDITNVTMYGGEYLVVSEFMFWESTADHLLYHQFFADSFSPL